MPRAATSLSTARPGKTDAHREARVLRYAAFLYTAGFLAHNADHLRRGVDVLTPEVLWVGGAAAVMAVAAITLVLVGHRLAPLVAVVAGFPMALGVMAVHLAPRWSAFSDAFPGGDVDALSWAAVLLEIASALAFGAAGGYVLRGGERRTGATGVPGPQARLT